MTRDCDHIRGGRRDVRVAWSVPLAMVTLLFALSGCSDEVGTASQAGNDATRSDQPTADDAAAVEFTGTITSVVANDRVIDAPDCVPGDEPDRPVSSDDESVVLCGDGADNDAEPAKPAVIGVVTVEQLPQQEDGEKYAFTITSETELEQESGRAAVAFLELAPQMKVSVTFSGPVAESYPAQATADSVTVLPGA